MPSATHQPKDEVDFIINHLFLPIKLPQRATDDNANHRLERALLQLVLDAAKSFRSLVNHDQQSTINCANLIVTAIEILVTTRDENGAVDAENFQNALKNLVTVPTGQYFYYT